MQVQQKNLTIVIVSFNSSSIIADCLAKINFAKYDVMVVDNASSDSTVDVVAKNFPQTKIIRLEKNIGYGRANNIALRQVTTDFAMVLNPDAFIFESDIEKILAAMQQNQQVALAGPLLLPHYPILEEDKIAQLKIAESNLLERCEDYLSVKYIIGAILFLKIAVFKKIATVTNADLQQSRINFFDENIFLYYEDDEISWRVAQSGYQAAIFPSTLGFHIGQGSSGGKLRNIYKRFWHRALSKLYWKQKQKGAFSANKSAIRLMIVFLCKSFFYAIIFDFKKAVSNFASCSGSAAFLIGLKAFDKNDNPRG